MRKQKLTTDSKKNGQLGFERLVTLLERTHSTLQWQATKSVDIALVIRNWLFGWYIVEFEKGGTERSMLYGKRLIDNLSIALKQRGIQGVAITNLRQCRAFYLAYEKIHQTVSGKLLPKQFESSSLIAAIQLLAERFHLGWSHYVTLLTIDKIAERRFYEIEATENCWSVRELKRQIDSSLYERLALSKTKEKIHTLSEQGHLVEKATDIIKNVNYNFTCLPKRS